MKIAPTQSQIEAALSRAQDARRIQDEIFEYVSGYDPAALEGTMGFTMQHVGVFVWGMMSILGIPVERTLYGGTVKEIRLPESLRGRFPEFGGRWVVRVTTDRRTAQRRRDAVLLDFETPFFRYLIECAKRQEFDGLYASTQFAGARKGTLVAFILRWQNDQGDPLTEEFVSVFLSEGGDVTKNPEFFTEWLVTSVFSNDVPRIDRISRSNIYRRLLEHAHRILAEGSTRFKHPNGLVEIAASDCDRRMH